MLGGTEHLLLEGGELDSTLKCNFFELVAPNTVLLDSFKRWRRLKVERMDREFLLGGCGEGISRIPAYEAVASDLEEILA